MSGRDAVMTLASLGVDVKMVGTGVVVNQEPAAGTPLEAVAASTLWLARRPSQSTDSGR
jgi:hypothetical protein